MLRSISSLAKPAGKQLVTPVLPSSSGVTGSYAQYRYFITKMLNGVLNIYDHERVNTVGPDRSCAEWVLKTGGRVRWVGEEHWVTEYNHLPPDGIEVDLSVFRLQDIDASGSVMMIKGFDHFKDLKDLKSLKIHSCQYINDSCLKMLFPLADTLQLLQVSANKKVTDSGLSHLTMLKNLTELHLKDLPSVKDPKGCYENLKHSLPGCQVIYIDAQQNT